MKWLTLLVIVGGGIGIWKQLSFSFEQPVIDQKRKAWGADEETRRRSAFAYDDEDEEARVSA